MKYTEQLKTWKDLLDEGVINQEQYKRGQVEGVKWVKLYSKVIRYNIKKKKVPEDNNIFMMGKIDWIKDFFNPTSEDLKEEEEEIIE